MVPQYKKEEKMGLSNKRNIIEEAYECFKKILKDFKRGKYNFMHVYIYTENFDQVCLRYGAKKDFFPSYIGFHDVEKMLQEKEFKYQKDENNWIQVSV